MQLPTIANKLPTPAKFNRLSKQRKIATTGALAATVLVLTATGLEATAGAGSATAAGNPTGFSVSTGTHVKSIGAQAGMASQTAIQDAAKQQAAAGQAATQQVAEGTAGTVVPAHAKGAPTGSTTHTVLVDQAKKAHAAPKKAHAAPKKAHAAAAKPAKRTYSNNLDGWIRQSLAIMHAKGIPGSYSGIHRNIIRESSGNPKAINLWDINAQNGIPSKGLLQVINPTFNTYHVSGTSWNIYNPVSNITAACNYAAAKYGSMDNVNSAY